MMYADEGGYSGTPVQLILKDIIQKHDEIFDLQAFPLSTNGQENFNTQMIRNLLKTVASNPGQYILTASTPRKDYFKAYKQFGGRSTMDQEGRFMLAHGYSIVAVNNERETITISNPHDTKGQTHTITYREFFKYFKSFEAARLNPGKIPNAPSLRPVTPRQALNSLFNQKLTANQEFSYDLQSYRTLTLKLVLKKPFNIQCVGQDGNIYIKPQDGYPHHMLSNGQSIIIGQKAMPYLPGNVSGNHVRLENRNGQLIVTDLDSTNGTAVFN